jgi:hypothetical protein
LHPTSKTLKITRHAQGGKLSFMIHDIHPTWPGSGIRPLLVFLVMIFAGGAANELLAGPAEEAETNAVAFLKKEVPAWYRDNQCYSCHNNGDAARALYAAGQIGHKIPNDVLADTTAWVSHPDRWENNKGDPGFSDKRLATVQFAASLLASVETGHVDNRESIQTAALKVAAHQEKDGSWPIEQGERIGSPATYGTALATYTALKTMEAAALPETKEAADKARDWLRELDPNNVLEAATWLMAFADRPGEMIRSKRRACLDLILRAQSRDGGWGPYPNSPPEPFDTAIVLLALSGLASSSEVENWIRKGRDFLAAEQYADGSWPATTRPPGGDSYAQRVSTTGWAAFALIKTRQGTAGP